MCFSFICCDAILVAIKSMFILILYFLLFVLIHHLTKPINNLQPLFRQEQTILVFIALFVFFGFRNLCVLNDTNHYYLAQYYLINSTEFNNCSLFFIDKYSRWEVGYQILSCIVGKIWANPYAIIQISAFATIVSTIWVSSKYTSMLSLLVFFLLGFGILIGQFSATRQGWALVLFYIAFNFLRQRKTICGIIFIMCAIQFHSSAIVLFALVALSYLRPSKSNIMYVTIICIIIIVGLYPILNKLDYGDSKYVIGAMERDTMALGAVLIFFLQLFTMIVSFFLQKKYNIVPPDRLLIWSCLLGLFFNCAAIKIQVFTRFSNYFGIFFILFLLHVLSKVPKAVRNNWIVFFVLLLLLRTFVVNEYRNDWSHLIPYSFFDFSEGVQLKDFGY